MKKNFLLYQAFQTRMLERAFLTQRTRRQRKERKEKKYYRQLFTLFLFVDIVYHFVNFALPLWALRFAFFAENTFNEKNRVSRKLAVSFPDIADYLNKLRVTCSISMDPKTKKKFPVITGPPVPNGTFGREKPARMLETELRITNYKLREHKI